MNYSIYKLSFHTGLHLGNGKLSDGGTVIHADTMFSALCLETLKTGGSEMLDRLVNLVEEDRFRISDSMPYITDDLYLPKPMIPIKSSNEGDSVEKKAYKKLKYVPVDRFDSYLEGKLDVQEANDFFSDKFGEYEVRTMVNLEDEEDAMPYSVGIFQFGKDAGLYFILGFRDEEDRYFVGELMESLSYTGVGGKRSSGLGKFTLKVGKLPQILEQGLTQREEGQNFMALSICLPEEDRMEEILRGARYAVVKRSGFISSTDYADSYRKKRDLIVFSSGSCFSGRFEGVLSDVSDGGRHPVYSYGKSLLMRIN
ncbi:MAG: type III-A CRISPR-associated RAMP protein Csm4 [Corynebacterium sp.]|nr:type III-A CRISPR-associated RAMP protein Csm4 [Corynebacterium sp.]